ncbi:hypothetical protein D3C87_1693990 [compost metagenome]
MEVALVPAERGADDRVADGEDRILDAAAKLAGQRNRRVHLRPAEGDNGAKAEVAAHHVLGQNPEAGDEVRNQLDVDVGHHLSADRQLAAAAKLAEIEVSVVLDIGAGRGEQASHRAARAEQVEARTVFRRLHRLCPQQDR